MSMKPQRIRAHIAPLDQKSPVVVASRPPLGAGRVGCGFGLVDEFPFLPFPKKAKFCHGKVARFVALLGFLEWRPVVGPGMDFRDFFGPPRIWNQLVQPIRMGLRRGVKKKSEGRFLTPPCK